MSDTNGIYAENSDAAGAARGTPAFFIRSVSGWAVALVWGAAGLAAARLFNLTRLPAALITLGLYGMGGGYAHARLLRTAGGRISGSQRLVLALVWAACCIGGALPLFFTMGTRAEMAVRAFYSFAVFGAAGGTATARVLRSVRALGPEADPVPGILVWSVSFSLAAVAGDASGEWLQPLLPSSSAAIAAILVMTLIIGCGSAYAVLRFFRSDRSGWRALPENGTEAGRVCDRRQAASVSSLLLLCLPFYLNDFAGLYVVDWRWWLLIDYSSVKLFPFLVLLYLANRNQWTFKKAVGFERLSTASFLAVFVIAAMSALSIEQNGYFLLNKLFGHPFHSRLPEITDPLWKWVDLSAGLVMVAVLEESIFRGYMLAVLRRFTRRPWVIVLVSAAAFGCIHWSGGLQQVVVAAMVGAVFMLLYLRSFSLAPVMLAHFAVNFIDSTGFIPPALFGFFSSPPV